MDIMTFAATLAGIVSTVIAAMVGISHLVDFIQKQREKKRAKPSTQNLVPASPSVPPPAASSTPETPPATPRLVPGVARSNLPVELTSFFGREQEVAALRALLRQPHVRLVTLLGPPGTGKTRLSLQVAAPLVDAFEAGVTFVALAPVRDPTLVAPTIAQTLGAKEIPGQPVAETLKNHLRDQQLLLILDNFEHVIPAAPLVAELLAAAPRLKVMVTSREVLSLSGEHEFVVPPLPLPDLDRRPSLNHLAQSPAVALFVQRARAVKPDFQLTAENAPAVVRLCTMLDGLPLVIELAAARAKLFSPEEMLTRLQSRFQWLTGGARDLSLHQQTLHSTLDWSYNLLEAGEQTLLRRLGVFVGGCSLAAIEAVCPGTDDRPIDVLQGAASLIDKSLLQRQERSEAAPRFMMLETIRDYALEQLQASGEAAAVQRRHAEYFLRLVEEVDKHFAGPVAGGEQRIWLDRLEAELGNLRAALTWSQTEAGQIEVGLILADKAFVIWHRRDHLSEGRAWLTALLARPESSNHLAARAAALRAAALLATRQGDYTAARPLLEESVVLCRKLEDKSSLAYSLWGLGNLETFQDNYERATVLFEESLTLFRAMEHQYGIASLLGALGDVTLLASDYPKATALYEEGLARYRELGNQGGMGGMLNGLGRTAQLRGDYTQAQALYEESLTLYRALGTNSMVSWISYELGSVAQTQGDYDRAQTLYRESLILSRTLGVKPDMAESLAGLAGVAGQAGQLEQAARLFGTAAREFDSLGARMDPLTRGAHELALAAVRAQLGEAAFAAAWAQGQAMTLDQAIENALSDPEAIPGDAN